MNFYDNYGKPKAYLDDDGETIFTFAGNPLGYLDGENIYSFKGTFLGWFVTGWIRDRNGDCVLFTKDASGGPGRPGLAGTPGKGGQHGLPGRGGQQGVPGRPGFSSKWSTQGDAFWK